MVRKGLPTLILLALLLGGCSGSRVNKERLYGPAVPKDAPEHSVTVRVPESVGALDTNIHDVRGLPVGISCRTCHDKGGLLEGQDAPENFHSKMKVSHGSNTCYSCHDREDRTKLHLSDGTKLNFDQAQQLCAQCHGVQHRDYLHGSHGGMTGYWDLKRGPRERNSCLDCHSPHTPKYAKVRPVHPPRDRFLEWKQNHDDRKGHHE